MLSSFPDGFTWLLWTSYFYPGFVALVINEFHDRSWGQSVLEDMDIQGMNEWCVLKLTYGSQQTALACLLLAFVANIAVMRSTIQVLHDPLGHYLRRGTNSRIFDTSLLVTGTQMTCSVRTASDRNKTSDLDVIVIVKSSVLMRCFS